MTENYKVGYSEDALNDLREIYAYIANELLVPETAAAQVDKGTGFLTPYLKLQSIFNRLFPRNCGMVNELRIPRGWFGLFDHSFRRSIF